MKQEIIDQMRSELYTTNLCKTDFEEYDVPSLECCNEPFFWMVRKNGTSLTHIGPSIAKYFESETRRMCVMRSKLCLLSSITYWNDKIAKYFYYDGLLLREITKEQVPEIFISIWGEAIEKMIQEHESEYRCVNEPLEVCFGSSETQSKLNESLKFAQSNNDDSLQKCIDRLQNRVRCAINHYIKIYSDFEKHCYEFAEFVNGECRMRGGIIYHGSPNEGYKENGNIQMQRTYGWQIHT